jgi:rod shape-determining protein MreD
MKPWVYFVIIVLLVPVQAALLKPLYVVGIKPDLALALPYVIGLFTGPVEGACAGIGIGLVQDISTASLIGFSGFSRGLVGLFAGLLGRRVLDVESPAVAVILALLSAAEGASIAVFMQTSFELVPFLGAAAAVLPRAFFTGLLGFVLLRYINKKTVLSALLRRRFRKES